MRRSKDGRLVLIDFGIVKQLGSLVVATDGEVKTTSMAGTPGYTPSGQAKGKPCPSSDLYALGMTAIEALTGISPYYLPEHPETGEVVWCNRVQVSDRLAAFLEKMVRDRYIQRYQSAIEALQALQQAFMISSSSVVSSLNPPSWLSQTIPLQPSTNLPLQVFNFEVVTVDNRGEIVDRHPAQANVFTEDLGNGISLEMVRIPGGKFLIFAFCTFLTLLCFANNRNCLGISVMKFTTENNNLIIGYFVNQTMFIGNPPRPAALEIMLQWFGFSQTCERAS